MIDNQLAVSIIFTCMNLTVYISPCLSSFLSFNSQTVQKVKPMNLFQWADKISIDQQPISSSEQDGKFRLAISYYTQGLIMSKTNKVQSIKLLNMALSIFVELDDKINKQKAVAAINSIEILPNDLLQNILEEKNLQEKMDALNLLIQKYPNFVDAYISRGQLYQDRKDYQKAIKDFDRAIALKPDLKKKIEIHEIRGDLHNNLSNTNNAIEDYDLAIQLEKNRYEQEVYNAVHCRMGCPISKFPPSRQDSQSHLANIHYKKGVIRSKRYKAKAIQDLQIALEIYIEIRDKTNEQKVRTTLNSIR
jgi:tetratricopeptide (TPR) repeat protein